jgi:hypothetical protein
MNNLGREQKDNIPEHNVKQSYIIHKLPVKKKPRVEALLLIIT